MQFRFCGTLSLLLDVFRTKGIIMDYKNKSQKDKCAILEHAVLTSSPEEVSALYRQLGEVRMTARALGLACRFRGLAHVQALVESGANFIYVRHEGMGGFYELHYWLTLLEVNDVLRHAEGVDKRDACFGDYIWVTPPEMSDLFQQTIYNGMKESSGACAAEGEIRLCALPVEQRAGIVKYLCAHCESACLDVEELLFYAVMSSNRQIAKVLKECGVHLSRQRITKLAQDGRSNEWHSFSHLLGYLGDEEFLEAVGSIVSEMDGNKLYYTESVYEANYNLYYKQYRLYRPDFFQFILEHFNQKKMNKTKLMRGAIDQDSVACLELCAQNGWLEVPRRRDEMIKYASDNGRTECSAWLLSYKNRTADFAAEREKAEKAMMRRLNVNPNSVAERKKIWGFEKREDGTVIITRYKGKNTEIDVPEKIGDSIVTAIGDWAFSPGASRLKVEQREFLRRSLTCVRLPDTIETIGKGAFWGCWALEQAHVPDGVTAIGERAFADCRSLSLVKLPEKLTAISSELFRYCKVLPEVTIPTTVTTIGKWAFHGCKALETVVVPEGVLEIGQLVFQGCENLKSVVLPQSVRKIKNYTYNKKTGPQTIFDGNVDVTVTVPPKSYAEKYCKRNGIRYGN